MDSSIGLRHRVVDPVAAKVQTSSSASSDSGSDDGMSTFTPPDFTIKDLLSAIPAHCFERSAVRSFSYIAMDLVFIAAMVYTATFINSLVGYQGSLVGGFAGQSLRHVAWLAYAFAASLPGTGLWVIAHECGHQAFSESKTLNNAVGWVLHSALLVPYHSWRISHAKHHAATGHMTRDQVFVPKTRSQRGIPSEEEIAKKNESTFEKVDDLLEDAPLYTLFFLVMQQLLGWPMYLIRNASGQKSYPKWTNHFNPESIIFDARHRKQVLASDVGIGLTLATLGVWAYSRGLTEVARYYIAPYLFVNHWLVAITFLQHTDPMMPHYRDAMWNFQRGALCTVDRHCFGFFMHGIAETHVSHHLSSKIPHYNAWEATEALKKFLGPYYYFNDTNVFRGLWESYSRCVFVEDEGDVVFFKDSKGKAARKVVYAAPGSDSGIELQ